MKGVLVFRLIPLVLAVALLMGTAPVAAQTTSAPASQATQRPITLPAGLPVESLSEAEQIVRLRKSIEDSKQQIEETKHKLDAPDSEFHVAEAEFGKLDAQLSDLKRQVQQAREKKPQADASALEKQIKDLTPRWDAARARFGLAVEERKTLAEKLAVTQKRLDLDSASLKALVEVNTEKPPAVTPAVAVTPAAPKPPTITSQTAPASQPAAAVPPGVAPTVGPAVAAPTSAPAEGLGATKLSKAQQEALAKAKEQVEVKKTESVQAEQKVQSIEQRRQALTQDIDTERKLMDMASKKQAQAQDEQKQLRKQLEANPASANEIWSKIFEARQRDWQAGRDAKASANRIQELEQELVQLTGEHRQAEAEATAKQQEMKAAETQVEQIQNPFAPRNMLQWLLNHGPKMVMILVGMWVLHLLMMLFSKRIADLVARNANRGTIFDRQNRANTLVGVFRQTASLAIIAGGTVMLLDEVGVPVVPLLGGAAVIGLAVAFGAQNLIRDYFAGFMVLVEDQYAVGDVVKIGDTAGVVERISLRMTMLRDMEGIAHFIPHGSITTVSNLTHAWSQVVVSMGVAYHENVDRVMEVLLELARELRNDPAFGPWIVSDPEMLGVDSFADSAVIIKMVLKTQPLRQWPVKRELLRRIKNRFDELGIEIPFPQLTIHAPANSGIERPSIREG